MSAAARLEIVRERIAKAAAVARRPADAVTLIAVTKGRTTAEIAPLLAVGQHDFGESRVQEALDKWPPLLATNPNLRLHCIGRLQSNKAADAVGLFDAIHSIDRLSLLEAVAAAADKAGRTPAIYIQVNIGEEPQKGGCALTEVDALVATARASCLPLAGLMAIPPADLQPGPYFALLADIARRHDVTGLSMGMSADYEAAVMLGATVVRVGSALFED